MQLSRLVQQARRGNPEAFAKLVKQHERPMYALAYSMLDSHWDAADAVQDAFTEAYTHLGELRNPDRFKPWLSRIVINKCKKMYAQSKTVISMERIPDRPVPTRGASQEETLDLVKAVRSLGSDHREVIALRYFCDLRLEDVARIMQCPVGTVKSRLNRALAALQHTLVERDDPRRTYLQEVAP